MSLAYRQAKDLSPTGMQGGSFDYGVEHDMTDGDDDKDIDYAKAIEEQFDSIKAKTFEEEVEETDSGYTGLCNIC